MNRLIKEINDTVDDLRHYGNCRSGKIMEPSIPIVFTREENR